MKPSAPWTREDAEIWRRLVLAGRDVWLYVHADRTDADIMAELGLWWDRRGCRRYDPGVLHSAWAFQRTA
jgi:hypothetical protein